MNRLRQMSLFAHIVDSGSISAAAEQLGLSKSVLSQHLKGLEAELGIQLLKRTTRRQTLTSAGTTFYQQCQQLNQLADSAWQQALDSQQDPSGTVRITAPHALMSELVAPALAPILLRWPRLKLELQASDEQLDLMAENIDLAIRVGTSGASNLKQRRLGEFRDQLCGTANAVEAARPGYIANHWQEVQIRHRLTHTDSGEAKVFEADTLCRTDSLHSCRALLEAGAGVGILPDFIFRQCSTLVPFWPGYQLPPNPIYALHPFRQNLPRGVEVCLEAIEIALQELCPEC